MRNLRRFAIAVLSAALVLTPMTATFAADSPAIGNLDKAVTLKDLGLYSGQDATDPKIGLEKGLTTQDSLIFLAKLFGYYDAATKLTQDDVSAALAKFEDAAFISDYAKKVVAYSAANHIMSGSTKDGKFFVGAKDTVTAARFATFMLKQMGYTVADYKQSVGKLAEIKGSKIDALVTGDLTRDAAIGVMYGVLTAEKGSGKTIIADIVGNNVDLKAKVEQLGIPGIEPEQPAISNNRHHHVIEYPNIEKAELTAKNKITLVFNQKMTSVSASDIELSNLTTPGSINVSHCESTAVNGNGKTEAVLVLDQELSTDGKDSAGATIGIITIADPLSVSELGIKLSPQFSIGLNDKTAPEIVMWTPENISVAKVIGSGDIASPQVYDNDYTVSEGAIGTVSIFFSEDIDEASLTAQTFSVTGFTITGITAPAGSKTVILTVQADADNTSVNAAVTQNSEIYDTAGNGLAPVPGSPWTVTLPPIPA